MLYADEWRLEISVEEILQWCDFWYPIRLSVDDYGGETAIWIGLIDVTNPWENFCADILHMAMYQNHDIVCIMQWLKFAKSIKKSILVRVADLSTRLPIFIWDPSFTKR